eukprot:7627981-Pyramimonas_sp.AAC.1
MAEVARVYGLGDGNTVAHGLGKTTLAYSVRDYGFAGESLMNFYLSRAPPGIKRARLVRGNCL